MIIEGKNEENPVLLFLHGGIPDYFLLQVYPTGLEELFTVVWWEQRGAGLSFKKDIPAGTITLQQMLSDTREVTNYLRERFGKEKIYLMERSGGTFIGVQASASYPELYHAYVGIGQVSDQMKSEKLAYEYIMMRYMDKSDRKMIRDAPVKGFYTFRNSAHSPHFEEPRRSKEIFEKDILRGETLLADRN